MIEKVEVRVGTLRYGILRTAGERIGSDRLIMPFTDQAPVRDVPPFPQLRPKK